MEKTTFTTTFTGMMSAFLIWAVHFAAVYGINGLICARALEGMELYGQPVAMVLVLGATGIALLLAAGVLAAALWGIGPGRRASEDPRRFIRFFTALAAAGALLAILWNGLPALQMPACG